MKKFLKKIWDAVRPKGYWTHSTKVERTLPGSIIWIHEEHYAGRYDPSLGDMLGVPHTDYCKSIGKIHKGECPTPP